ncbi:MAG: PIN domain-containing protein [Acidimicrobiales bacterium]
MRLVVDPGVLVSALITPLGPPAQLWQAVRAGRVQLIVSPRLLAELAGVLEPGEVPPVRQSRGGGPVRVRGGRSCRRS